jgi:hypothetical protein
MGQTPSLEANSRLTDQEILHLLWNPKAYYHIHYPEPSNRRTQSIPSHAVFNAHFNIILPCTSTYAWWAVSHTVG